MIAGTSNRLDSELLPRRSTRVRLRILAIAAASVALFAGLIALLYSTSIHSAAGTSDKATTILAGQSVGSGHLLLQGWILPPGNYWTSDVTFYAAAIRLFGFHWELLYIEPAVVAAVTIVIGVLIGFEGRRGPAAVAGAVSVVTLLAFATPAMALWFVGNGFHIATALYTLVAFAALRKARFGWAWALSVALIAFGMLGDLEIVAFAVIPLFLAGLIAMLRQRRWQSGIAQITAAIASAAIGEIVHRAADALGAFKPGQSLPIAHLHQMVTNLGNVFSYGADLLGITNGRFGTAGIPRALLALHAVGGLCVVVSLLATTWGLVKGILQGPQSDNDVADGPDFWRLDDLLLIATVGSAALFVVLAGANGVGIHFLSVPVVFASVLTGRMVARAWSKIPAGWVVRIVAAVGVAVSLTFAAGLGDELSRPAPIQPITSLTSFLEGHNLRNGIGGYWASAITSVVSNGTVNVRPVGIDRSGEVDRMMTQSPASWYAGQRFQFFVSDTRHSGNVDNADIRAAERTWGTPTHYYSVGYYRVLVWSHTIRVAAFPSAHV